MPVLARGWARRTARTALAGLRSRPGLADALQHGERLGRTRSLTRPPSRRGTPRTPAWSRWRPAPPDPPAKLVDVDADDLGRGLEDGPLDRELQGDRRGRAAVAAAEQPQPDGARVLVDAEQLDVALRGAASSGRTWLEGAFDPVRQRVGMEAVHQQEAGDQLVLDQGLDQPRGVLAGQLHDPGQAGAVQVGDEPEQLLGEPERPRIGRGLQLVEQLLDPVARGPEVLRRRSVRRRHSAGQFGVGDLRRRVQLLQHLALAEVHVHPARQARVEAAHRPHDVDALEMLPVVLLEDRRVDDRVLVGPGRAVDCRGGWRSTGSAGTGGSWRSCRP